MGAGGVVASSVTLHIAIVVAVFRLCYHCLYLTLCSSLPTFSVALICKTCAYIIHSASHQPYGLLSWMDDFKLVSLSLCRMLATVGTMMHDESRLVPCSLPWIVLWMDDIAQP
ncbi:hypothetical protein K503DRAFT_548908 [Rhizopogon vinicolor AM-OR11-026]|uniref:Uncharacterized protein n=1 Tax=Rhizopogon vinicolor AM-OR11-026 TaxID=1314800 RepID=A0A1B7MKM9_9AGAM|nr:hypothetical protein K503DRAFT_548908 [Rhizopogon vinicolor AM-OR11-026]